MRQRPRPTEPPLHSPLSRIFQSFIALGLWFDPTRTETLSEVGSLEKQARPHETPFKLVSSIPRFDLSRSSL